MPQSQEQPPPEESAQEDLQAKVERLEALVSTLRHDIRSALAPAMLAADSIRLYGDARAKRSADVIGRSVDRVLEVLQTTRDVVPPRGTTKKASSS